MRDLGVCLGGGYLRFVTMTHQGKESVCPARDWHPRRGSIGMGGGGRENTPGKP